MTKPASIVEIRSAVDIAQLTQRWSMACGREKNVEKSLDEIRLEKGKLLVEARKAFPGTGRGAGWAKHLESWKITDDTALRYMKLAGYAEKLPQSAGVPTYAEAGIVKSKNVQKEHQREEEKEGDIEDEIDPKRYETAFLIRADQSVQFASYSGPINKNVVTWAWRCVDAWTNLAREMEKKL